jgi:simple sugar transport system ATP-binding protein
MEQTGLQVPLDALVSDLSIGSQQRVEILKVLLKGAELIILDEPTAVLTPGEVKDLFKVLHELKKSGKTLILITHKLKEILEHTDDITILRAGESVAHFQTEKATLQGLADAMVGRQVKLSSEDHLPRSQASSFEVLLKADHLSCPKRMLKDLNFEVRSSEIVGIAGVEGNGQAELLELLLLESDQYAFSLKLPHREEMGLIPTDRQSEGLLLEQSAAKNFILGQEARIFDQADEQASLAMKRFDVRPLDPKLVIKGFSGGNQQKLIIARELSKDPKLLIASQPTRGVDVGAIEFIHSELLKAREMGKGILLVSSELDEIFELSDRVLVMFKGEILGEFERGSFDKTQIGVLMGGQRLA